MKVSDMASSKQPSLFNSILPKKEFTHKLRRIRY
jgi:hypothetical protein